MPAGGSLLLTSCHTCCHFCMPAAGSLLLTPAAPAVILHACCGFPSETHSLSWQIYRISCDMHACHCPVLWHASRSWQRFISGSLLVCACAMPAAILQV
jgi:hypothetical protein